MTNTTSFSDILRYLRISAMAALAMILLSMPTACDHSDLWNELPGEVTDFINQYFPNSELQSVSTAGGVYHVRIDDGPGLTFDSDKQWTDINGYGMPIPQVLLFDQLPPQLYSYLQETENLNSVFSISRDKDIYTLSLLDSTLTYNAKTGEMRGSNATDGNVSKN